MSTSSIRDVARHTGVSIATVSRALRGLPNVAPTTRKAVEQAALQLGYTPSASAAGLASGRYKAVAAIVPTLNRWFNTAVLEGADRVLRQHQLDMFVVNLGVKNGDRERVFHNALLRKRADAVLALGVGFDVDERRELRSLATPVVVVGGAVRGVRDIGIDERRTAATAVEHLLSLGHTRIGHISGEPDDVLNPSVPVLRKRGWEAAMERAGLQADPAFYATGAFLLPHSRMSALAMLSRTSRPTAIFAASDEMAFGVLLAAAELGLRVPQDLSVVGIDDHDHAEAFGLTTMRQDPFDHGEVAARLLVDELAGVEQPTGPVRQATTLVLRRSTAPPAADAV